MINARVSSCKQTLFFLLLSFHHFPSKLEGTKQNNCVVCSNLKNCKDKGKDKYGRKKHHTFEKNV